MVFKQAYKMFRRPFCPHRNEYVELKKTGGSLEAGYIAYEWDCQKCTWSRRFMV